MSELKTLKNLSILNKTSLGKLLKLELKAEAVKWVKSFDEKFGDRAEFKTGAYWFCLNFFNLTEEDFKEVGEK
jgi:hypothetical protein